ncbi:MAG: cyclodeaminase/cyclohydrolase family protein [Lachnospiraceae bacterium]|nr:cyclodeaminase/cyclohydrolase family protein [Lachnospiraceae bacterium]
MSFTEKTLTAFTEELASKAPVPGGGGAAALTAAVGVSLADMVGELTVGKKTYADVEEEMRSCMEKAQELRRALLKQIDGDAEAFAPLAKAYGIPKEDPERDAVMEEALKTACAVPMDIMRKCCEAIDLTETFAAKGSKLAVSDAGCAAVGLKASLQAASLNVFINTKAMKDRAYAEELEREAERMLAEYEKKADAVYRTVTERIRG